MENIELFTLKELGLIQISLEEHIDNLRIRIKEEEGYLHPAKDYEELYLKVVKIFDNY